MRLVKVKMGTCDGLRTWFRLPERLVIFTFGLLFSKGMMWYVLQNLITFLTDSWNLKLKEATAIVNFQEGLRNMLQIYVAFCIDVYLGYRRMLILSGVLYSAGLVLLAFSVPRYFFDEEVCPENGVLCFKKLKHTPFWEGLALLIAGGAAQVIPLKSLSFDQTRVVKVPEHCEATRVKVGCCLFKVKIGGWRQLQQRFVRWLCIASLLLGSITSVSGFIFIELEWQWNFLISAIAIAIGLLWFLCGFPCYGPHRLQPSPLPTVLRVFIAAMRKRHLNYRENLHRLHRCDGDDQNQLFTDHLECLNNAAVEESPADDNSIMEETRWKLCTVKEVEQTKLLLNIIPMSVTFIAYGMVKSLGDTFFIEQTNNKNGGIPIAVFLMIQQLSEYLVKKVYDVVFERRIKRINRRYSDGVKIGLGMLASVICCAVASSAESKRLKAQGPEDRQISVVVAPTSAFWLVLQFFLLGAMEGLAGDGIQDFFGHYAPDSRRYGPVFTRSLTGFGTLLNIGFIAILEYYSEARYKASWIGDSIDQSRLDCIYRAYVIVALLNCFLYAYVATWYSYDNIIGKPEEEEEIPFLEVKEDQGQVSVELRQISVWD